MQPQYAPQQPQYPAGPPQPPAQYPPASPYPMPDQQYPPQPQYAPQYPPQQPQYAPPQYAPQPSAPVVPGTLDQFYNQPSTGGGKALTFEHPGQSYTGIVTRPISNSDIQQQTDTQNRPAFFKDGRPKFVMKVPLQMQPSQAYPDGLAQWYIKGNARDELVRAMAEVGAPEGPPEAGSIITITMTGTRPSGAGMNPTKLFQVIYQRPQAKPGAAPAAAPPAPAPTPAAPAPSAAPSPIYQPAPPPVYATNGVNSSTGAYPVPGAAPAPQAPAGPPPAPPAAGPAVELSADQRELLAKLTGQPSAVSAP